MGIVIGADFIPTANNMRHFESGNADELFDDKLIEILQSADYRIFNLEGPLTKSETRIDKCGPAVFGSPESIELYFRLKVDLLTLANNHILDCGEEGLRDTLNLLDEKGIKHIGAGSNVEEAFAPSFFTFSNKTVGVYACAEHEFSIASEKNGGANPADYFVLFDHLEEIKNNCDFLIVLYHGGKEYYRYPSPFLQRLFHKMADSGADLVIAQHTHCIGCEEKYHGSTLVYGQGNFYFDSKDDVYWNSSLLINIDENFIVNYFPIEKINHKEVLSDNSDIIKQFYDRSREILDNTFVQTNYEKYAKKMLFTYYDRINKNESLLFKAFNKLTKGLLRKVRYNMYDKKKKLSILNVLECEAHRELFSQALKIK